MENEEVMLNNPPNRLIDLIQVNQVALKTLTPLIK